MLAYLNGKFIPLEQASIPVWDFGFTMGVSISEQLRTFNGKLEFLNFHLERLARGLAITEIEPSLTIQQIGEIATEIVEKNSISLLGGNDLGVGITITAGPQAARAPESVMDLSSPTILIYALPLGFKSWAADYQTGVRLKTVRTREIPNECIPRELKCRSRMHYYLAEKEASKHAPGARAVLLDSDGNVAEATTASLLLVKDGIVIAPRREAVLPSVSVRFLETMICPRLSLEFDRRDVKPAELAMADELLLLSTSACVLPVSQVDDVEITGFGPNSVFSRIMTEWSAQVGCDIIGQANAFGFREPV